MSFIFSQSNKSKAEQLVGLIDEITEQSNKENKQLLVTIGGEVRFPGIYPLTNGMVLQDLIDAAGGFTEASYLRDVTINRFRTNFIDNFSYDTVSLNIDEKVLKTYVLNPRDYVQIKRIPDWQGQEVVKLRGEFKFPGTYVINKGESLAELVDRAGGFTKHAFIHASIFNRQFLAEKEQVLIDKASQQLRKELITTQINNGVSSGSEQIGSLLALLEDVEPTGRMTIRTQQLFDIDDSISLRDGDELIVPRINQAVSVIGEVYVPTSIAYESDKSINDYINNAGGFNKLAEESDVYVIKANGVVSATSNWFSSDVIVEPGDTIVVPTEVDAIPTLTLWHEVSSVIYQSIISVAALAAL